MSTTKLLLFLAGSACLAVLLAQPATQTAYTVTEVNGLLGQDVNMTIYRNGSKALIDQSYGPRAGSPKGFHVRTLYDLQTGTNYSWDLIDTARGCGAGNFSGDWGDPFAVSAEITAGLAGKNPQQAPAATINGIATRVFEKEGPAGKGKAWVEPRTGLVIKAEMTPPGGAPKTMLEVKQMSLTAPAASVFVLPSACAGAVAPPRAPTDAERIAAETGGNAADYADATMPPASSNSCSVLFRVVRAGSLQPVTSGFQVALDTTANPDRPANYVIGMGEPGKSSFSGGGLHEVTGQLRNGVLRIDNAPATFHLEANFGNPAGDASALIYRQCVGPQTVLLFVVKNPGNLHESTDWLWAKSGKLATVDGSAAAPAAASQGLPAEFPLPPGVTITRITRTEFDQDEFSYPNSQRTTEYLKVAGHMWRAFVKGDQQSVGVPSWKAALEPAGWQVLNPTPGNTVARRGEWWAKIGPDRFTLIQRVEAEAVQLTPPGDTIEELKPNQDVPYITPLPTTSLKAWKTEPPFELKGTKDAEPRMLGPAIYLRYEGVANLSGVEVQTRYNASLLKAGWDVVRSDAGGVTGAHYTKNGRDVWVKITPVNSAYTVEVADMGAASGQDKLAKALDDVGHVALYGIYFDSDKSVLRPDSEATLVQIQKLLASHPAMNLEIQGHTDNTGTRPHNDTLSQDRAASVKAWLVGHGIGGGRLTAKGYADTKPVAANGTPEGRALNRRVELARP